MLHDAEVKRFTMPRWNASNLHTQTCRFFRVLDMFDVHVSFDEDVFFCEELRESLWAWIGCVFTEPDFFHFLSFFLSSFSFSFAFLVPYLFLFRLPVPFLLPHADYILKSFIEPSLAQRVGSWIDKPQYDACLGSDDWNEQLAGESGAIGWNDIPYPYPSIHILFAFTFHFPFPSFLSFSCW